MSQNQPPLPPEMGDASARQPQPNLPDYIEIEIPAEQPKREVVTQIQGGSAGCVWLLVGMFGCTIAFMLVIFIGLMTVGKEVDDFVGNIGNFFNLEFVPMDVPDNIYVPPVERIQALSEIVTARFNYAQVVTGQAEVPAALESLYGNGLVMVAVGHIEAGIDVSTLTEDDIRYDTETQVLHITLPSPVLRACFLDDTESYVVRWETGLFAQPMPAVEDSTRRYALRLFRENAIEDGILETAADEILKVMDEFLGIVVSDSVEIDLSIAPIDVNAPLPDTCP